MKNLKRVSCAALACVLLSVLFVMPSYAAGFGGGSRPGSFGSGGFGGATAQTCISYDALSDLCVDLNARLANGDFGASWKSYGCTIVKSSDDFYVIRLIVSGTTYYFRNASGGVYYTTERPSLINSIYGQLWSTYNGVRTDIAVLTRKILEHMDTIAPVIEKLPNYLWGTYNGEKADLGALSAAMLTRLDTISVSGMIVDLSPVINSINTLNTDFSANLDSLVDKFQVVIDNSQSSVDNVTNVVIDKSNDAYNVFYVVGEDGEEHSIGELSGNSLSASGKLLQFLYRLCVENSLVKVDDSIEDMSQFYLDSSSAVGVNLWD